MNDTSYPRKLKQWQQWIRLNNMQRSTGFLKMKWQVSDLISGGIPVDFKGWQTSPAEAGLIQCVHQSAAYDQSSLHLIKIWNSRTAVLDSRLLHWSIPVRVFHNLTFLEFQNGLLTWLDPCHQEFTHFFSGFFDLGNLGVSAFEIRDASNRAISYMKKSFWV